MENYQKKHESKSNADVNLNMRIERGKKQVKEMKRPIFDVIDTTT